MCDAAKNKSCRCGCEVRGLIQPRLLLLLSKKACHGYELMEVLRSTPGSESMADPGMLYRTLRQLEELGAVKSAWDTARGGPARRIYELTAIGWDQLESWAADVRASRGQLDQFLNEYESVIEQTRSKKRKRGR